MLQLEAERCKPGCLAHRQDHQRQRRKRDQHAAGIPETVAAKLARMSARRRRHHAERLHRQDRQHARHQVQDQPTEEGKARKAEQPLPAEPGHIAGACHRHKGGVGRAGKRLAAFRTDHIAHRFCARRIDPDDAFQRLAHLPRPVRRQQQARAVRAYALRLFRRMADLVFERKEAHACAVRKTARQRQAQRPRRRGIIDARLAFERTRHFRNPRADQVAGRNILRRLAHGQHQRDIRRLRNTDRLTDQVIGHRLDAHLAGGICGHGERQREHRLVIIAIVHDLAVDDRQQLWQRPHHLAQRRFADARSLLEDQLRRQARIPGIAPVDVPARIHGHLEGDEHGFARQDACALGNQFGLGAPPIAGRLRGDRGGEQAKSRQGKHKGAVDADHHSASLPENLRPAYATDVPEGKPLLAAS